MHQVRQIGLATLAAIAAFSFQCAPASAQDTQSLRPDRGAPRYETVMIYAPYVVKRKILTPGISKETASGLELVSVSQTVSFADLDLSDVDQVRILKDRVRQAARSACGEIDKKFPKSRYIPIPPNQDCVGNALSTAMVSVKALEVAAARY